MPRVDVICLVTGILVQNAGKSLVLQRLSDVLRSSAGFKGGNPAAIVPVDAVSTMPTIGTELTKLLASRGKLSRAVTVREVGGQMQPIWHHYFDEAVAVMFVVDTAAPSSLAGAAMALFDLLEHQQLQGKPLCVVLNKRDDSNALSNSQLDTVLRLHDLQLKWPEQLQALSASAVTGEGLGQMLQWIDKAVSAGLSLPQQQREKNQQQLRQGAGRRESGGQALARVT